MRTLIGAAVLAIALSACSSSGDDAKKAAAPVKSDPPISDQAVCTLVPLEEAVDLMLKLNGKFAAGDGGVAHDLADELNGLADRDNGDLKPHLRVMAEAMTTIEKALNGGGGDTIDPNPFRASAAEVHAVCG